MKNNKLTTKKRKMFKKKLISYRCVPQGLLLSNWLFVVVAINLFCLATMILPFNNPLAYSKTLGYWFESDEEVDCRDHTFKVMDLEGQYAYEKIIEVIIPLIEKGESYQEYHRMAGTAYYHLGKYDKALAALNKAYYSKNHCYHMPESVVGRENSAIKYVISEVYKKKGNKEKSKKEYEMAVELFKDVMGERYDEGIMNSFFNKLIR